VDRLQAESGVSLQKAIAADNIDIESVFQQYEVSEC
jgi:hypothetical protein